MHEWLHTLLRGWVLVVILYPFAFLTLEYQLHNVGKEKKENRLLKFEQRHNSGKGTRISPAGGGDNTLDGEVQGQQPEAPTALDRFLGGSQ